LATGFAILLGLIVFLAFTSYDQSRSGAETEALLVVQQYETAQFMPAAVREKLGGQVVCYGRSVVHQNGRRCRPARVEGFNPWGIEFPHPQDRRPADRTEQAAYDKQGSTGPRTARKPAGPYPGAGRDRVHVDRPLFISAVIFVFMLFL
jgi:hypothetical protein